MAEIGCEMVLIETADFKEFWECSGCLVMHNASKQMEACETCPSCGRKITQITRWVGVDDDVLYEC